MYRGTLLEKSKNWKADRERVSEERETKKKEKEKEERERERWRKLKIENGNKIRKESREKEINEE